MLLLPYMWHLLLIITSEYDAYPQTKLLHSPFYLFSLFACGEHKHDTVQPPRYGAYYPHVVVPTHSMWNEQFVTAGVPTNSTHQSSWGLDTLSNSTVLQ